MEHCSETLNDTDYCEIGRQPHDSKGCFYLHLLIHVLIHSFNAN